MDPVDALRARLPEVAIVTDADVMDAYRRDEAPLVPPGKPLCVVIARTADDVVTTMRWASEHRVPVVPRGAGSGLSGGATAVDGCAVLSLAHMTRIRELNPADQIAVVEPGVINADLDRAAGEHGLMYAPDPSSHEISTIGGNLATNAGGLRCVKYGVTRDSALGLEVVLADGRLLRTGRRTVKGVAGYDLTSLFVGSEGTLGVITAATMRLLPRPENPPATVAATFPTVRAAGEAAAAIIGSGIRPSLLELLDQAALRAIDDWKNIGLERDVAAMLIAQSDLPDPRRPAERMAALCEAASAGFVAVSSDEQEARQLLEVRRMAHWAFERLGVTFSEDVCVPRSKLPDMIERIERISAEHGVHIPTVGHAGDGNLHPVFILDRGATTAPPHVWAAADEVFRSALELGGTLTGEHGVGVLKRRWLEQELGPESLAVHRSIKQTLDPLGILNPGKVI